MPARVTARPLAHEGIQMTTAGAMALCGERRDGRHSLALVGRIESVDEAISGMPYGISDDDVCDRRLRGLPRGCRPEGLENLYLETAAEPLDLARSRIQRIPL